MIRPIDGVVSAHVDVNRPKPRNGFGPPPAATAFVLVETEKDRELSSAAVESIQGMVAGMVPEVRHDAVSVFDRKGRHYSDALDPALGAETRTRHRRDALRQEILDKLDWLNGADVSVQFVPSAAIPPPNPILPPLPSSATPKAEPPAAPLSHDIEPAPPSMIANQPLDLPTESDEPARNLVPPPVLSPAPAPVAAQPAVFPPPRAKVWVKVPRSYYLKAVRNREPSLDDLQPFVDRTKGLIETAVRHVVPPGQLDEPVVISTIPDESAAPAPAAGDEVGDGFGPVVAVVVGDGGGRRRRGGRGRSDDRPGAGGTKARASQRVTGGRRFGFGHGPVHDRRADDARPRPLGARPRTDPAEPRSRRQRPAPMDRTRGDRLMTRLDAPHAPISISTEHKPDADDFAAEGASLRKAAVLLVSLEQPLASQLLAQLDRAAVEAVTLEIARLDRVDPDEQHAVLEEFYGLGLRRLRFVFDDLVKMDDRDVRGAYHVEDAAVWVLALAAASRPVRAKVLGALPADAAEAVSRGLAHLGPFRLGDSEAAQADIAGRLRRLHDLGQITLPDPNGQEEILV